jgi:hypothetical protein
VSSGLIYAVIVGLWAVVLVPVWLRRHDEVSESRSVDRFQGAMRTLSRRDPTGDRREVWMPRRTSGRALPDNAASNLSAGASAAARRRRAGLVLTVLTVLVASLALLKVVPKWTVLVPLLLLVAFVVTGRRSAAQARERELAARRRRAASARRARMLAHELADDDVARAVRSATQPARSARPAPAMVWADAVPEPGEAPPAAVAAPFAVDGFYDAEAERAWDPVPVPLPTYVSAPKAPRSVRVIDLTAPGAWTSGHLEQDPHAEAGDGAPDDDALGTVSHTPGEPRGIVTGEVLVERRRAVGD